MKNSILIFAGYNYRGVIAFCRFCNENNIKFHIVASSEKDKILISKYEDNVIFVRQSQYLILEEFLQLSIMIRKENETEKIVLLPSTEYLNRFLLQNRGTLEENNFVIPLCNSELYTRISDKFSFSELCRKHNINIPREYINVENAEFPFVIKSKKYFGDNQLVNQRPQIINTEEEIINLNIELNNSKYYYQEFISGKSFYLLYFIKPDGNYSVFSQENLLQQNNGLSIIAAVSSDIHNSEISNQFAKLLVSEGFGGLIMIEVKKRNDQFYMIEANPRLWGPSQLIIDSGMDLFYQFAMENGLLDSFQTLKYLTGINYLWSGGIIEDQSNNENISFYNYSSDQFFKNYYRWINSDVLKRPDTQQIYESELN